MNPRKFALIKRYATLDGLTDVDVGSPVDGYVLVYDSATGTWVAQAPTTIVTLDDLTDVATAGVATGGTIVYNGSSWVVSGKIGHSPGAVFGDGNDTASIAAGLTGYIRVPYTGTIRSWHLVADVAVTCTVDIWKANASLPSAGDKISASAGPSLTAQTTATSTSLGTWTTRTVAAGDIFGFYLLAITGTPKQIVVTLEVY